VGSFYRRAAVTASEWHYMPVLKVKLGEKAALTKIAPVLRARILPLVEVVVRKPEKSVDGHLDTAFAGLPEALRPYERCLLDAREIAPDGASAAEAVFSRAAQAGLNFTAVTGLSRSADVAPALANKGNGVALRLTREEFEAGGLGGRIGVFLDVHHLDAASIDLVVDLGAVDSLIPEGVANLAEEFLAAIPDHAAWRTFTLMGCAFPYSMRIVERNGHTIVERAEWKAWRDALHARRHEIARLPAFGDCGIQHPAGVEGFDPKTMPTSAAVRYTLDEDWLLIKGQSTRSTPPSQQFPRLARRLVSGDLSAHFAGCAHCAGCAGVSDASHGAPALGSLQVWRRLGTIHHITTAVQALAGLSWT
jgi:hypothetical protein